MSDWKVNIEYKNENMETVVEKEYDFIDYTAMVSQELLKVLWDIENAFYVFSGNKKKEDWTPEEKERFGKIRHKMLNQINAIKRLPNTLSYKNIHANTMSFGEYLARNLR